MKALRSNLLLLLPSLAIFVLIFAVPLLYFFVVSFWTKDDIRLVPTFTIANYATVFAEYARPLIFTFGMAILVAVVTTVLAFVLAYVIRFKAGRYSLTLLFIVLITLFGG